MCSLWMWINPRMMGAVCEFTASVVKTEERK